MLRLAALLVLSTACTGEGAYRATITWERYRANLKSKIVHAADHDVHYLEASQPGGAKETVVLLHGFGVDKDTWVYFLQALERDYRLIAMDLPGFGDSTRDPTKSYDVHSQIARVHAVLQELHVRQAHFVGNSMGGAIAAGYALTFPNEVVSLTLLDPSGVKPPAKADATVTITEEENPLVISNEEEYDRLLSVTFVKPPYIPSAVKRFFIARAAKHREFTAKVFADLRRDPLDLAPRLAEISSRTLIVWGAQDRVIDPSAAEVFAKGIAKSHLVILPEMGHAPMLEKPKETARLFERFVAEK